MNTASTGEAMSLEQSIVRGCAPVPAYPAPWNLTGRGYLVFSRFEREFLRERSFASPDLARSLRGSFAMWMFIEYATADCGPYRELLFIPGKCDFESGRFLTISKIYVSSEASVVNGRRNWGIPKELAGFKTDRNSATSVEHVTMTAGGVEAARLVFKAGGPRLPMIVPLLPKRWLTLGQRQDGREYVYTPWASGRFRMARLLEASVDERFFPDLSRGRTLACFELSDFKMIFPLASIVSPPTDSGSVTSRP